MDFIDRKIDGEIYVSLDQVNIAIEEKKAEIENIKATHYAEMVSQIGKYRLMKCINVIARRLSDVRILRRR